VEYKKQTHAERMAAPPAVYMSPETFGDRFSGPVMFCGEYTHKAFMTAAMAWAALQPGNPELNATAMQRAIAHSGIRPEHIETPRTGYLSGWSRHLISLYTTQLNPRTRIATDVMQDVREVLATPRYYTVPSPDPLFTELQVRPTVSYAHSVTIDGVRWSVTRLLGAMQEIEDCYSESGAASLHGSGYEALLAELLTKYAGLTSTGGYHSAPRYQEEPWQAFKERLEKLTQIV
jgi:hypothetical protein